MFRFAKTLVVSVGVLMVASTTGQAQVIYGHENSNLAQANKAMMAGELKTASKYFGRAVKANLGEEKMVTALNNFCAVEYAIGHNENAEKVCSQAIGEDRRYWRAYVNRGNARAALGKQLEAEQDYERAIALKPGSRIAKNALASFRANTSTQLAKAQP